MPLRRRRIAGDPIEGSTQGRRWHRGAGARFCPKRSSERGQSRRRRRPLRQGFQLLLLPLPTLLLLLLLLQESLPGLRKVLLRRVCGIGILLACGLLVLVLVLLVLLLLLLMMMMIAQVLVVVVVMVLLLLVLLRCPGVLDGMALRRTQPPRRAATARARELGTLRCRPDGARHGPRRRAGGSHGLLHLLQEHALSGANARSR